MFSYKLNHLEQLEAEAIFIIREAVACFEKPVVLFSGGKDSIVMAHIAHKAFWPARIPMPLLHVDTGHNFSETIKYRDNFVKKIQAELHVASVQKSIDEGKVIEEKGNFASRNSLQTTTLLDALEEGQYDCALGGGRRDEEKARAKERFFSHRDDFGQWDPKKQRPELWNTFNPYKNIGEHFRVFPLSNWTEMDIWQYIKTENIELPNLYFSHSRKVFIHNNTILAYDKNLFPNIKKENCKDEIIRFRTIGDITCTGAVKSIADNLEKIIEEVSAARQTERGTRTDDKKSDTSMEDRKKEGYF